MKKKIAVLTLCAVVFALCSFADAQQPAKIPRIGYVALRNTPTSTIPDHAAGAFREGLRELGYVEGKNIFVEYRYAEGKSERIPGLVDELVRLKVDVLVSPNSDSIQAAKQASKTIPVVMVTLEIQSRPVSSTAWRVPAEISPVSPGSRENLAENVSNC